MGLTSPVRRRARYRRHCAARYRRSAVDDRQEREVEEARLVLDARQELYGESDPTTFDAMLQLGRTLRDAGELREAARVLTTSLSLQNRLAVVDEVRVRWTEFNLAIVLDRLGEHEATRRLWEQVLESSDRDDGPDSDLSRQTAINLAITFRKLRRYGDEFPLRVRVLDSARRTLGPDSAATFRAEIDLAQTHRHLGNHELALGMFTEALAGLERNRGDQRTILHQKWAIATELVALKRSKEASEMFDQVVAGAVEHLEPDDPFRRSAVRQRRAYSLLGKFSGLGRKARRKNAEDE
jgi:tetratricopeptide (TPR) repeat protein